MLFALVSGSSSADVKVGDPPSFDHQRCLPPDRPCSDPFVIGAGKDARGRVELVGMTVRWGSCVRVERREWSAGYCNAEQLAPVDGDPLQVNSWGRLERPTATEIVGAVRGDVQRVQVRYTRGAKTHREAAVLASPTRKRLRELEQPKRFGFFVLALRGCIPYERITVVARNGAGRVLGRETGSDFFPPECPDRRETVPG